jgi:hypothetical protein
VILSHKYFSKSWTLKEFYALLARESRLDKVIIPVLHDITPEELAVIDPGFADRFGLRMARGMEYVVREIVTTVQRKKAQSSRLMRAYLFLGTAVLASLIALYGYIDRIREDGLTPDFIVQTINKRIEGFEAMIRDEHIASITSLNGVRTTTDKVQSVVTDYKNLKSRFRNEYEFYNGYETVRFKKNVEPALQIDFESLSPANGYQMIAPTIYLSDQRSAAKGVKEARYAFVNVQATSFTYSEAHQTDEHAEVLVVYRNNIRYVGVMLAFAAHAKDIKRQKSTILGFINSES